MSSSNPLDSFAEHSLSFIVNVLLDPIVEYVTKEKDVSLTVNELIDHLQLPMPELNGKKTIPTSAVAPTPRRKRSARDDGERRQCAWRKLRGKDQGGQCTSRAIEGSDYCLQCSNKKSVKASTTKVEPKSRAKAGLSQVVEEVDMVVSYEAIGTTVDGSSVVYDTKTLFVFVHLGEDHSIAGKFDPETDQIIILNEDDKVEAEKVYQGITLNFVDDLELAD